MVLTWLAEVVAPLNHVVFVLGNDQVTRAEILGFVTGAACVWLTVKGRISNFPVGIANSSSSFSSYLLRPDSGQTRPSKFFTSSWVSSGGGSGSTEGRNERGSSSGVPLASFSSSLLFSSG